MGYDREFGKLTVAVTLLVVMTIVIRVEAAMLVITALAIAMECRLQYGHRIYITIYQFVSAVGYSRLTFRAGIANS